MKKRIFICACFALVLITAILTVIGAIDSYNYDMNPDNGVDILEGFGAALIMVVGGIVVFYELDLCYTIYYFAFTKTKTIAKTILIILSHLSLLLILIYGCLSNIFMELRAFEVTPLILFITYIVLRIVYSVAPIKPLIRKDQ